jgi:hypothetical protein
MRNLWVLGIIALIFLAACTPAAMPAKQEAPVTEKEASPVKTTTQEAQKTASEPMVAKLPPARPLPSERQATQPPASEVVVTQKATMSPALRDLLKRADEKVSSIQFLYGGTDTSDLFLDTYLVKGTKMRVKKYKENYYVREGYYDNIYVDSAAGCCEELSRCKSANVDNTNKKFDIDLSLLKTPKTPYQWIKEVPSDAQIVGPQTVNSRSVTFIKYNIPDGSEVQMWVDDNYGVPHKVVVVDKNGNPRKYQFNDMVFNTLKDADFVAPCAK